MPLRDIVEPPFEVRQPQPGPGRRGAGLPGGRGRRQNPNQRTVRAAQYYWLNMAVPFTSVVGESVVASTLTKYFPLLIRAAWSNLVQPRIAMRSQSTGIPISTLPIPLLAIAGNTNLAHPLNYWERPYLLRAGANMQAQVINDGGEAAGLIAFYCERPDREQQIPVTETREYILVLDLGLTGGATQKGTVQTQAIDYDLLIYGILSTSQSATVLFTDTGSNQAWSSVALPIGSFSGIRATGNVQQTVYFSKPYYLAANTTIQCDWTNTGSETGKHIAFICERIVNGREDGQPPVIQPNPVITLQPPQRGGGGGGGGQSGGGGWPHFNFPPGFAVVPAGTPYPDNSGRVLQYAILVQTAEDGTQTVTRATSTPGGKGPGY